MSLTPMTKCQSMTSTEGLCVSIKENPVSSSSTTAPQSCLPDSHCDPVHFPPISLSPTGISLFPHPQHGEGSMQPQLSLGRDNRPCICTRFVTREGSDGMDKDGTLDISFDEWRDYLLFHPSANLHDIIMYWRHATTLDIGEDLAVPDDFSLEEWLSGKWWRHLASGGVAGAVSRTCTAPLDRLKIFLQVYGNDKSAQRRSIPQVIKYMLSEGGVKGLWRGNGINVLKIAPESALKFAAYEKAKYLIKGDAEREVHVYERLLAGSMAGAVSQTAIYPMEVLKTRLALRKTGQYKNIADCAVQIFKREGMRPFYRGYLPNLLGIIPYAGIDLAVYETLKRYYIKRTTEEGVAPGNSPVLVTVCCGAFSSTCGQMASYPLALVRTRLQAQVIAPGVKQYHPPTMVGLFKHIVATEGFTGLYRGITPNFLKVIPAVSISYVVYEKCRNMLGVGMT